MLGETRRDSITADQTSLAPTSELQNVGSLGFLAAGFIIWRKRRSQPMLA
jgi:hypothetical protein